MLGKSFSHYRVLEPLGQGGMGVVYLAEDTLLGRRVAIKFPHADGPSQRLLKEARTASSLNHPAIAAVYDCGMFEDHPYVVMEFVEGENLGVILARGPLPPKRALEIAAQAAARFLDQTTWGPTPASIAQLQQMGIANWLSAQFALNTSDLPDQPVLASTGNANENLAPVQAAFFQNAVTGQDQLRRGRRAGGR